MASASNVISCNILGRIRVDEHASVELVGIVKVVAQRVLPAYMLSRLALIVKLLPVTVPS